MNHVFPVLDQYTYLNTPAQGLVSNALVQYRNELINKQLFNVEVFVNNREEMLDEVRTTLARFIDAPVELTALVSNFSLAFNNLLEGIDRSSRFLLLKGDYPSINAPIEARKFECVYATIDQHLEENIRTQVTLQRPDFLCFSLVQYISGIKIDLKFIKRLKEEFPSLIIIVDATQYIGVEKFCFRESGIDIIAASCYKWMHAGNGNAFICFKEHVVDCVKPYFTSSEKSKGFNNERGSFMGNFEPGHLDLIAFCSLKKAIELIKGYGQDRIQKEIETISLKAKDEFTSRNLLKNEVVHRDIHSSIFNLKGDDRLFDLLISEKILCSQRGDGIRVGFSYFNTVQDLNKLLNIIDTYSND